MFKLANGLVVPKLKGCGGCNDPAAQEITDALLAGLGNQEALKICDNRITYSTIGRHHKHLKDSIEAIEASNTIPIEKVDYALANPALSSDGVRLVALEEMIESAKRLKAICKTKHNLKAEETYLRALSQIEMVASKLRFK